MAIQLKSEIKNLNFFDITVSENRIWYSWENSVTIEKSALIKLTETLIPGKMNFLIQYEVYYGEVLIAEYLFTHFHNENPNFAEVRQNILSEVYKHTKLIGNVIENDTLTLTTNITKTSNGKAS